MIVPILRGDLNCYARTLQAEGTATTSYVSLSLSHYEPPQFESLSHTEHREEDIMWSALSLYTGGADTVSPREISLTSATVFLQDCCRIIYVFLGHDTIPRRAVESAARN